MEMKYYNPSNNFRAPIPREPKPYRPPQREVEKVYVPEEKPVSEPIFSEPELPVETVRKDEKQGVLSDLDKDDMLLLGLLAVLILNACDDYLLLVILGYLFISGRQKNI